MKSYLAKNKQHPTDSGMVGKAQRAIKRLAIHIFIKNEIRKCLRCGKYIETYRRAKYCSPHCNFLFNRKKRYDTKRKGKLAWRGVPNPYSRANGK